MIVHYPQMNNEIHIKIGADHGGNSFKACYQICNINCPNNKDNTVVFSIFEAKDHRANMKTGMNIFKIQIDDLQQSKWRLSIKSFN